jgi:NAD(P)-dependent dehydrogenase (short-subunit alcohol dehydrogenase family)
VIGIFGGGEIAENGIIPVVGGEVMLADVTDYWAVSRELAMRAPTVVVNCAGVSSPATTFWSDHRAWKRELDVNLLGAYHVAKASVMLGVRTMVFIASVAGLHGKPGHGGYCASKAGVISLVQSLALEGHDAYAVSPGRVDTQMRERDFPGEDPLTRLTPRQVGEVVREILAGAHTRGDNVIVRKRGHLTEYRVDRGEPWRAYLQVGEPPAC